MKKFISYIYKTVARWYLKPILLKEYKKQKFSKINERPIEFVFAFKCLTQLCPREVLDVGSGQSSFPHLIAYCGMKVTAIDEIRSYWKSGLFNRHYYLVNDDITESKIKKQFDLITCISVLEHIPNYQAAVRGMVRLLKPGGSLVLTFPFNEKNYIDNVYRHPSADFGQNYSFICHVFSRNEIDKWLKDNNARIIIQEYYEAFTGDFWCFGEPISPARKVSKEQKHHLTCILIQKRYLTPQFVNLNDEGNPMVLCRHHEQVMISKKRNVLQ